MNITKLILSQLLWNEDFTRASFPYLKESYFESPAEQSIFRIIKNYFEKYNKRPNQEILRIELENSSSLSEQLFQECKKLVAELDDNPQNLAWLLETAENWAKERAIYNGLLESLDIIKDKSGKREKGQIVKILEDAIAVSFDQHIGHDYLEDADDRYESYHTIKKRIPFDIDILNKITGGGVPNKTLTIIMGGVGVGKANPITSIVPTPNGYKRFGNLKIGDKIFGSNGKTTTVTGIFPQGKKEVFKITFSDGRTSRCCKEHLWNIFRHKWTKNNNNIGWKIKNLEDIIKYKKYDNQIYIQLTEPVEYPKKQFIIHPYNMGCILGDGDFHKNTVRLTNTDLDLIEKYTSLLPKNLFLKKYSISYRLCNKNYNQKLWLQEGISREQWYKNGNKVGVNDYILELRKFGLIGKKAWNKFIPKDYLFSSIEDRFELLRGLLDTDGTITKNGAISFISTSKIMAEQVVELVRSLGGWAKLYIPKRKSFLYKNEKKQGRQHYLISIRMKRDIPIFSIQRKLEQFNKPYQYENLKLRITNIKSIGKKECQCISVDASDHLYLIDSYIVTHNTATMCSMAAANMVSGKNVLYITLEMSEEEIGKRVDANLLDVPLEDINLMAKDVFDRKVAGIRGKTPGKLIIHEYPTSGASVLHFKHLLHELRLKKKFKPDIIYIDYLNICCSSRVRMTNIGLYGYVQAIVQEVRGLAIENDVPIISATQLNREGFTSSDPGMEHIAESFGSAATADVIFALIINEELIGLNQIMWKQIKNRLGDLHKYTRFVTGRDLSKMRLYNCESPNQIRNEPLILKPNNNQERFDRKRFEDFK